MRIRRLLETELPNYKLVISSWADWLEIRNSGAWNKTQVSGNFSCAKNNLTSLVGAPTHVRGDFTCFDNLLTSLEGGPTRVRGDFSCSNNNLTTLKGAPNWIGGDFYCTKNNLTSLEGAPEYVGNSFFCFENNLTSLVGAPTHIRENLFCYNNKFTSLKDIHKHIKIVDGKLNFDNNPIVSNVLGLLLIQNLKSVHGNPTKVFEIINKHLKSDKDVLECQEELISSGYKEFAKL